MSTEEIINLLDILTSKCVQFEILIETKLFVDKKKIKEYCEEKNLQFRFLEEKMTIPIDLINIRK